MNPTAARAAASPSAWAPAGEADRLTSEDDCLALIDRFFPAAAGHVLLGRGDDCAELRMPGVTVLSTDAFLEGAHFRRSYFTPEEVGAKALAGAASDLAGAGAVPLGFALTLLLPADEAAGALAGVFAGMAGMAERCGLVLAGGDISRAERLGFCLTVWGGGASAGEPFFPRRGQARPGDLIFLVGPSGLAHAGLLALEDMGRAALPLFPAACAAHLAPVPLLAEGAALARALADPGARLGLMDLSDGPARDLPRLLGGPGADLDPEAALIHPEIRVLAERHGRNAEDLFLLGGEDYGLIGTCAPDAFALVRGAVPGAALLGTVEDEPGLRLRGLPLRLRGFDHLSAGGAPVALAARVTPAEPAVSAAARELIRLCREAWTAGLLPGYSGNASIRVALADGREACLITRSGAAKGRLREEDLALLSPEGALLCGPKPSSEAGLHLAIYRARPETRVILHTHPPHLTAESLLLPPQNRLRPPLFETAGYRDKLALVPDLPPGTADLAEAAAAASDRPALWLERHGLVAHGANPDDCLALTEELEHLARVAVLSRARCR